MTKGEEESVKAAVRLLCEAVESAWKRNEPVTIMRMSLALGHLRAVGLKTR